jgi:hypothetical protein
MTILFRIRNSRAAWLYNPYDPDALCDLLRGAAWAAVGIAAGVVIMRIAALAVEAICGR